MRLPEDVAAVLDRAVAAAIAAGGASPAVAALEIAAIRGGAAGPVEAPPAETAAAAERVARLDAAGRMTVEQRQAAIDHWRTTLTPEFLSRADLAAGRALWRERCGVCHRLFGEGGGLGPELTGAGRGENDYAIINVIHPNASVPDAWRLTNVVMDDGRVLSGVVAAADERTLTLRTVSGEVAIDREEVDEIVTQKRSAMPEGLWNDLGDEQVRDLVAYLASPGPPPASP